MCVCVSLQSHNCSRSRFLPLSRKLRCVRVCARVCVFILMFSLECARVGLFPKRRTEKRDFSLTVFPTTFSSLSGSDGLYPNPRTQTLISVFFFAQKSSSRKFVPKTSHQHSSSPTQFEKSLEDERNVSPRDVITRRATTTSSGARRCC